MKYLLLILSIFVSSNSLAKDYENDTLVDLLIFAKATGMCGTIKQMVVFQEITKMPGGDEFIMRFLNTEMARLDKTLPQFLKECEFSISEYTNAMKSLELDK